MATEIDSAVAEHVKALMRTALPIDLRDDRFDGWPPIDQASSGQTADDPTAPDREPRFVCGLASVDGKPVGYLGGELSTTSLVLDALIDPTVSDARQLLDSLYSMVLGTLESDEPFGIELWAKPAQRWHVEVAEAHGLAPHRALHQMRCDLPVSIEAIESRSFDPASDFDAVRNVNNRAFASHPDQGGQSAESFAATMAEPWFNPDGLRVHERDGVVAGFCWTKIHPEHRDSGEVREALGEIYVIGVDPDYHGQGLGAPMTAAGLSWLVEQGLTTGMLYVEADNVPAIKTYERLGFSIVRTDRAWARSEPETQL